MDNIKDITKAKKAGSYYATAISGIGIVLAYFIMILLTMDVFWVFQVGFGLNVCVGAVFILVVAKYIGRYVGWLIIIRKRCSVLIGICSGFLILVVGTVVGSSLGFIQEGLKYHNQYEAMFDYIVKPIYWVTLFGFIPVIISGIYYGLKLKQKRKL